MLYRVLLGLDCLAALAAGYFFLVGLADGSVSEFNLGIWLALLLGVAAILGGGIALRRAGRPALGNLVLALLAVPTALYGLFIVLLLVTAPNWQ